jgi:hypothetical protein
MKGTVPVGQNRDDGEGGLDMIPYRLANGDMHCFLRPTITAHFVPMIGVYKQ